MAPPRHGTEGVPSRLRLAVRWSLLAAEPAVHEDHTQYLSQIPHRFWFWAPTDTRFGGQKRGASLFVRTYPYKACACQLYRVRCVCTCVCVYGVINLFD